MSDYKPTLAEVTAAIDAWNRAEDRPGGRGPITNHPSYVTTVVEMLQAAHSAQQADEPQPTVTDRGFKHFDVIPSTYGGGVKVYESSAASAPHIWLASTCPANLNAPDGPAVETTAHLTLENAILLRNELTFLINNHYQRD